VPDRVCQAADGGVIRVLVWDERAPGQEQTYGGKFLGEAIAAHLEKLPGMVVKTTNLEAPEQGCDEATLEATDVVIWWAHHKALELTNANAERVTANSVSSHCIPRTGRSPSCA